MENSEHIDFLTCLEAQGSLDLASRAEVVDEARRRGARISDRQLTTYVTEGLVPRSARLGKTSAAYPWIVVELLLWISVARCAGRSFEAIRELVPVWLHLARVRRDSYVDLSDFEDLARRHVTSLEAAFAVPWLFRWTLTSPLLETDTLESIRFRDKANNFHKPTDPTTIEFVVAAVGEDTGQVHRVASMPLALPMTEDKPEPTSIVVGIPHGFDLPPSVNEEGANA